MQCGGIKISAIWPNQRVGFRVNLNSIEKVDIPQWSIKLSFKYKAEVNLLLSTIMETDKKYVISCDVYRYNFTYFMFHFNLTEGDLF